MTTAKWKTDLRQLCINETIKQKNFTWNDTIYTAVTPHRGIDKCSLEFLLSLKVVMLKRLEFHKEELYATLSQLVALSEIRRLAHRSTATHNPWAFIQMDVMELLRKHRSKCIFCFGDANLKPAEVCGD